MNPFDVNCKCIYRISQVSPYPGLLSSRRLLLLRICTESIIFANCPLEYYFTEEFRKFSGEISRICSDPKSELEFRKKGHLDESTCLNNCRTIRYCENIKVLTPLEVTLHSHDDRYFHLEYNQQVYSVPHSIAISNFRDLIIEYLNLVNYSPSPHPSTIEAHKK